MRKTLVLTVLLACLSLCAMVFVYIDVSQEKAPVLLEETMIAGNREDASDISVKLSAVEWRSEAGPRYENNWTLSYLLKDEGAIKTTTAYSCKAEKTEDFDPAKIYLTAQSLNYSISFAAISQASLDEDFASSKYKGLRLLAPIEKAVRNAAAVTEKSKSHTELINLSDYLDYVPVAFEQIGGYGMLPGVERRPVDSDYFNIPIPENMSCSIAIRKNKDGSVGDIDVETSTGYYFDSSGLIQEDGILLAVTRLKRNDADGSGSITISKYPKAQRGIHYIPYRTKKNGNDLDMEKAQLIFPLSDEAEVLELTADTESGSLILFTKEKEKVFAVIIDRNTMVEKEKLFLMDYDENDTPYEYKNFKDCTLMYTSQGRFALLCSDGEKYQVIRNDVSKIPEVKAEMHKYYPAYDLYAGMSDGRGVILLPAGSGLNPHNRISHYLLVYTKDHLVYAGFYRYSLDSETFDKNNPQVAQHWNSNPDIIVGAG